MFYEDKPFEKHIGRRADHVVYVQDGVAYSNGGNRLGTFKDNTLTPDDAPSPEIEEVTPNPDGLEGLSLDELIDKAKSVGIHADKRMNAETIIAKLKEVE